jgi:DNA-binding response OmpR family regulator
MDLKLKPSPESDQQPARVLIVDDDLHSRQLLQVMLSREGFDLATAANGEEALAMVAKQPPHLILLDVSMPEMDGYAVAAKIKSNLSIHSIPIILITALNSRNARMLGLGAGADDFLSKPVDRSELCVRVRHLLRLTYGDRHDRYRQTSEALVAKPLDAAPPAESGIGEEAARLIAELSLPWQKTVLRIVLEIHDQVVDTRAQPTELRSDRA